MPVNELFIRLLPLEGRSHVSGLRGLCDLVLEPATTRLRTTFLRTVEMLAVRPRGCFFMKKMDRASNAKGLRVPEAPSYANSTDTQSPGLMMCSFQVTCTILFVASATASTVAARKSSRTRTPFAIVSNWQGRRANFKLAACGGAPGQQRAGPLLFRKQPANMVFK